MITELVEAAKTVKDPVSGVVSLCVDWLGRNDETHATEAAIRKMDNNQSQALAVGLLKIISETRNQDAVKKSEAEKELTTLFGKEILQHAAVQESRDGFFFSLTANGKQFRAWYAPFGRVTREHFDSCGTGCVFSAHCDSPDVLRKWLSPFVAQKAEWESGDFGSIWMGHGSW